MDDLQILQKIKKVMANPNAITSYDQKGTTTHTLRSEHTKVIIDLNKKNSNRHQL